MQYELFPSERFLFLSGGRFSPTERAFFLNTAFRYPLPAFHLTSGFGIRRNPVTGHIVFHEGLDLAAPEKTEVYACREGTVQEIGYNALYGNYVLLKHEGGWTSLYGHLSAVLTVLHKNLQSGSLLGRVGSTGQSTGPHLHFELRQNRQTPKSGKCTTHQRDRTMKRRYGAALLSLVLGMPVMAENFRDHCGRFDGTGGRSFRTEAPLFILCGFRSSQISSGKPVPQGNRAGS